MHIYLQVARLTEEKGQEGRILSKVPPLSSLSPWPEFKFKQRNKKEMHATTATQLREDRGKPALLGRNGKGNKNPPSSHIAGKYGNIREL